MMASRSILNLILAGIVMVLAAVIVLGPDNDAQQTPSLLTPAQLNAVTRLQRWHHDELTLAANKINGSWKITSPFSADANDFQINSLLALTQQKSISTIDPADHALKKFGLDKPAYRLALDEHVLSFGATDPLNFRRYVLLSDTIHLVDDSGYRFMTQDAAMFVSRQIVSTDKVIVRISTGEFTLSRQHGQDSWTLKPADETVSADAKNRLVDAWRQAQAVSISPPQTSDNLSNHIVSIDFADNTQQQFRLLTTDGTTFLVNERNGLRLELADNTAKQLFNPGAP